MNKTCLFVKLACLLIAPSSFWGCPNTSKLIGVLIMQSTNVGVTTTVNYIQKYIDYYLLRFLKSARFLAY